MISSGIVGVSVPRPLPATIAGRLVLLGVMCAASFSIAGCGAHTSSTPATPTFTPGAGTYTSSQTVTVSEADPNAVVYCTTDGSTPTTSSPVCGQPVTVSKTETLSAIAAEPQGSSSAVATAAYRINLTAAATPVISPAPGSYTVAQSVMITDATAGAVIYFTLDGTTPTSSSSVFSAAAPIEIATTATVNAIAIANGYSDSAVATSVYVITPPAPVPVITPPGGTFTGTEAVTISDPIAGATIYYTIDGSTPTVASNVYSGPIVVAASGTLNAAAIAPGYSLSPVASATINLLAISPVISPAGGSYVGAQTVTIADTTPGSAIFYTTNGNPPTTASTPYTGSFTVSSTETVQAIAVATGYGSSLASSAAYSITLTPTATPAISPAPGVYTSVQTVTITDSTPSAAIYYTTNGIPPTTASTPYTNPITVTASGTVLAIAVAPNYSQSAVASAAYTINLPAAATPVIAPAGGTFTPPNQPTVTLSDSTLGAQIYYTTDGSTPSATHGTLYMGSFQVTSTETVTAVAVAYGYSNSAPVAASFTITQPVAATPAFSPAPGTFTSAQTVTITDATAGATIFYTTDGSTPSASHGTAYSTPIAVSSTETLNAIATVSGYNSSAVAKATYTINLPPAATPVITPATGTFSTIQSVTITDSTPGAVIYYTVDGSTPTTNSAAYNGTPISVATSETINAIATAPGYSNSAEATPSVITLQAAVPLISPAGGSFSTSDTFTITDATPNSAIYYTLTPGMSGTTPTTSSNLYNGAITVTDTETVEAIAVATGFNSSTPTLASTFTLSQGNVLSVTGTVSTGSSPIIGASAQLYSAGISGYGSAPTAIGSPVTTDSSGGFTLHYTTCPAAPNDQFYVVATGGSTTSGQSNTGLALMTALGSCASLGSGSITVNEVTTIASVYALSGFAAVNSAGGINVGAPAPTVTCATANVGNSNCNYPGLLNAFNTVGNLISTFQGTALTITPAYAANPIPFINTSTVPQARINTLADILATCVEDSSTCSTLFSAVPGTAPIDTIQATFNIAQNPGTNVAGLWSVFTAEATPPYTPTLANPASPATGLTAAPNDWTLAITFTGAGLGVEDGLYNDVDYFDNVQQYGLALDANGNVWVAANAPNSGSGTYGLPSGMIAGFNNLGAPLTPSTVYDGAEVTQFGGFGPGTGFGDDIEPISFGAALIEVDPSNNLWIGAGNNGSNYLAKVSVGVNPGNPPTLALVQLSGNGTNNGYDNLLQNISDLAFDPSANLWVALGSQLDVVNSSTGAVPSDYTSDIGSALAFDSNGSLWAGGNGNSYLYNSNNGNMLATDVSAGGSLAAGSLGNIYTCNSASNGYLVLNSSTSTSTDTVTAGCNPLVVDGVDNIWSYVATNSGGYLTVVSSAGSLLTPPTGYTGTSAAESPTLLTLSDGRNIAIDGSGNAWVANQLNYIFAVAEGNSLVEYIGVAAPTIAPLSVATQNLTQGTRP